MSIALRTASTVLAVALISQPNPAWSQSPTGAEAQLIAMEHEWIEATLRGDADAFAAFMADEYVAVVANARVRGKAEWVDGVRSGRLKYAAVTLRNLKVRLYGDTAVVTGEYAQTATSDGQDYSARGAYATTWLNQGGRWRAIASGFSRATVP